MKFKKLVLIILTIAVMICLSSCTTPAEGNKEDPIEKQDEVDNIIDESIISFNENINKISLGMDITEVESILGENPVSTIATPSSILAIVDEENRVYKNGLSVYTIGGTAFEISTSKEGVSLGGGAAVGDSAEKLLELCGDPGEKNERYITYHSSDAIRRMIKIYEIEDHNIVHINFSSLENGVPNRNLIGDEDFHMNNIYLHMEEEEFLKAYTDTPSAIEQREIDKSLRDKLYKYENGVEILLTSIDDYPEYEIYSISFTNHELKTNRGLKIGDSIGRVLDLYGFPQDSFENRLFYGYEGKDYNNFEVTIEKNVVTRIEISLTL